jgi:hypothetical protein
MAQMNLERSRPQDAQRVLLDGSRNFLRKPYWEEAVRLLRQAQELSRQYDVEYALALALHKSGESAEAVRTLEGLAQTARKRRLRQVRWLLFRIESTPRRFFHWLLGR